MLTNLEKINQLKEGKPLETQNVIEFLLWEIKNSLEYVKDRQVLIEKLINEVRKHGEFK